MSVSERLKEYIKYENISVREFEKQCGLSYSYVNNIRSSISIKKMTNIARQFPKLNLMWLLFGKGKMLLSDPDNCDNCGNCAKLEAQVDLLKTLLRQREIECRELYNRIRDDNEKTTTKEN
jgi:transcriptional regulator with XRE-family HTH domain